MSQILQFPQNLMKLQGYQVMMQLPSLISVLELKKLLEKVKNHLEETVMEKEKLTPKQLDYIVTHMLCGVDRKPIRENRIAENAAKELLKAFILLWENDSEAFRMNSFHDRINNLHMSGNYEDFLKNLPAGTECENAYMTFLLTQIKSGRSHLSIFYLQKIYSGNRRNGICMVIRLMPHMLPHLQPILFWKDAVME